MKVGRELTIEDLDNLKDGDKVYIEDVVNENIDKDGIFNVLFKNHTIINTNIVIAKDINTPKTLFII